MPHVRDFKDFLPTLVINMINTQSHIYIPAQAAAGSGSDVWGQYIQAVVLGKV